MGRRFVLSGENLTLSTGSVLAALQPAAANAAGSIIEIERVELSQSNTTTLAQVRVVLSNRDTAGTLTVTGATPSPLVLGGPASGLTSGTSPLTAAKCGVNSSVDSGGTYVDGPYCNPTNLGGYLWQPINEHKLLVVPGKVFVVRFVAAPTTLAGWTVAVWFHEVF